MRRLTALLVIGAALTLASCGGSSEANSSKSGGNSGTSEGKDSQESANTTTKPIPSCSDLSDGIQLLRFEHGCSGGTDVVYGPFTCTSGDVVYYIGPDGRDGTIYWGLPTRPSQSGTWTDWGNYAAHC